MKRQLSFAAVVVFLALVTLVALSRTAHAATFTWDANGAAAGTVGTGPWDTTSFFWNSGANTWPAAGTDNDAVFSGNAGTVSIAAGGVTANDIAFNTTGYTIQNNTLTLNGGTTPTITHAANVNATISSAIAGTAGLTRNGSGVLTLSGTNTYSGTTTFNGDGVVAIRVLLDSSTGTAVPGNLTHNAWLLVNNSNNQFGANTVVTFNGNNSTNFGVIELLGHNQTVAGISGGTTSGYIENVQLGTTMGNSIFTINTVNAGDNFSFAGVIRNSAPPSASTSTLGVTKTGPGTQSLSGANIVYTGATTVNNGTLRLVDATAFNSAITVNSPGILEFNSTAPNDATADWGYTQALSGNGTVNKTGTGWVYFTNNVSLSGQINVQAGVLSSGFLTTNWSANTANLNVSTGAEFDLLGNNVTIGALMGTGTVDNGFNSAQTLTLGAGGNSGSFSGSITNTSNVLSLVKTGAGTQTLSGIHTYSGSTSVNAGVLSLDYSTQNNSKLSSAVTTGILNLGGGTLNLTGGSHTEAVLSTSLTANTSSAVTRTSGASVLQMNAITRNAGAAIEFGAAGIATTDTLNTNGILGSWATVGGTDWAINSTNGADGSITALAAYTDVTRLSSGSKVIANGATTNVRIVEGTGGAANITLGAAITTINTLNQSAVGGSSAATIDPAGQTLRTSGILVGAGAGGLTIGTGVNNGTLQAATAGGELILNNQSANGLTINSIISNNTSASSLTKTGPGTATITSLSTYTGATTVNNGTLRLVNATTFASPVTINTPGILEFNSTAANDTTPDWGYVQNLSGSGTVNKTGPGWVFLAGTISMSGQINVQEGKLTNGILIANWTGNTAGVNISSGAVLDLYGNNITTGALTGAGEVWNGFNGAGSLTNYTLTVGNGGGSGSYSGVIRGNGTGAVNTPDARVTNFIKTGSGTQTLTSVNTFSGTTLINGGILSVSDVGALGQGIGTNWFAIQTGGTLQYTGTGAQSSTNRDLYWNSGNATIDITSATGNLTFNVTGGTLGGTAADNAASTFTKTGAGTLTIATAGANLILSKPVVLNAGTLALDANGANFIQFGSSVTGAPGTMIRVLSGGTGAVGNFGFTANWTNNRADMDVVSGGRFATFGNHITVDALTGGGELYHGFHSGAGAITNIVTVGVDNGSGTFSGVIHGNNSVGTTLDLENGTLALLKTGSGTQTLTGTNTYAGATTVQGGTLELGTGGSIANTSSVTVGLSAHVGTSDRLLLTNTGTHRLGTGDLVVGSTEIGTVDHNAGIVTVGDTDAALENVRIGVGAAGIYNMLSGNPATLNVGANATTGRGNLIVGDGNTGALNVGPSATINTGDLLVGNNAGSGTVTQTGGTINVLNPSTYTVSAADPAGTSIVNQSGGTTNVTGGMVLGNGTGASTQNQYNLSGGILDFGDTTGATAHHGPGTTPASTLTINTDASFNLTNTGALQDITTITPNSGTFTQAGGRFFIGQDEPPHVLSPGNNPGLPDTFARTTTINGGFSLLQGGTVYFDAFGPDATPTLFNDIEPIDLLRVTGAANLNGIVDFDDEYGAEFGDVHTLLLAPNIVLGPNFAIDGGFFRVVPTGPTGPGFALQAIVPEPASIAAWSIIGVIGAVCFWSRRRRITRAA